MSYCFLYTQYTYIEIVGYRAAEHSMLAAVDEVQVLPDYSTKGEVCVTTDKFHDFILSSD